MCQEKTTLPTTVISDNRCRLIRTMRFNSFFIIPLYGFYSNVPPFQIGEQKEVIMKCLESEHCDVGALNEQVGGVP
jgi:hypothetical protein